MDPADIIHEIGGGLAAVVIVAEALVVLMLWRRLTEVQDKLYDTQQTYGRELREMQQAANTTISANATALQAATTAMQTVA